MGESTSTTIYMTTNVPDRPEITVRLVVSKIVGSVDVFPKAVTFGKGVIGSTLHQVVAIVDRSPTPRVPTKVTSTGIKTHASITPVEPSPWAGAAGGMLVGYVEIIADTAIPGEIDEQLTIWFGESKPVITTSLLVSGRVVKRIEAAQATILLPRMSDGAPIYSSKCMLRSSDNSLFQVRVESCPPGWSAAVIEPERAARCKLVEVSYRRSDEHTTAATPKAVKFIANIGDQEEVIELVVGLQESE